MSYRHGAWSKPPQPSARWDTSIFDDECSSSSSDSICNAISDLLQPLRARENSDNSTTYDVKDLTYRCHSCTFTTRTVYHFGLHLAQHLTSGFGVTSLKHACADSTHPACDKCGYLADGSKGLNEHMKKHQNEAEFLCPYCLREFSSNKVGVDHCKVRHPTRRACVQAKADMYARMRSEKQMAASLEVKVVLRKCSI